MRGFKEVVKTSSADDRAFTVPSDTDYEAGAARAGRECDGELAISHLAPIARGARHLRKTRVCKCFEGLPRKRGFRFSRRGKGVNYSFHLVWHLSLIHI